jgi:Putative MetA-pathway of phenol degradation
VAGLIQRAIALAAALGSTPLAAQEAAEPGPIADNSFLIEEAYNQESGVVQHISTFARSEGGQSWDYSFTQEWPYHGIRHQLSYTLPVQHQDGFGTGLGDIALNYRYQLVGQGGDGLHLAPRASLLLPTGNDERGRGAGGVGFQANLPLSIRPVPMLALHANGGVTYTPTTRNPVGQAAGTWNTNLGGSAIWLLRPSLNLMFELLWLGTEDVVAEDRTARSDQVFLNPGVRWAFNFDSGLQVVPGVAYTVGLADADGADGLFLYLSFEHPFRR